MVTARWGELSRADLAERTESAVLLPTGATEQHGPHLPVDTDTSHAAAVAVAAARRDGDALVLPALPYGYSPHHGATPGTVSLSSETFLGVVGDVLASLDDAGFRQIAVINGHGGNRALLKTAASDFRAERGRSVAVLSFWDLAADVIQAERASEVGGVSHAGEMETAIQLHLREALVGADREDAVRDDREGYLRTDLFGDGSVYYPRHFDEIKATGVSGAPSSADAEFGERVFEAAADGLAAFLAAYREW